MFKALGEKTMSKPTVYYAHSLHLYGSKQEERDIKMLEDMGWYVYNPNNPSLQEEYAEWKEDYPDKDSMEYFKGVVLAHDIVAYRCHVDLKIPSGVMKEVDWALEKGMPVFELPTITQARRLSVEETREYLKYNGQR